MALITLTTDFGLKDHSVGAVKGLIYNMLPKAKIVDITHLVTPFGFTQAAYILKNAYKNFPKETIHIIGVDSEFSIKNKHLVVKLNGHFFICADNGIISMVASEIKPEKIIEINSFDEKKTSFAVLDIFVKTAYRIAQGEKLHNIGKELTNYKKLTEIQPKINSEKTLIKGEVIYIDNYGNVISNISKSLFESTIKKRNFEIIVRNYTFSKVHNQYNDIVDFSSEESNTYDATKLALFNSANLLEIAVYRSDLKNVGGASTLLGLGYRDTICVEVKEN